MAIFGKKLTLDEILKAVATLDEEEKAKVLETLQPTEEPTEVEEVKEEPTEEVQEEETTEEVAEEPEMETEELTEEQQPTEEVEQATDDTALEQKAEENSAEIIKGLTDRVAELESKISGLDELIELKGQMQDYIDKQKKQFGYEGGLIGEKKSIGEMSTEDLKKQQALNI